MQSLSVQTQKIARYILATIGCLLVASLVQIAFPQKISNTAQAQSCTTYTFGGISASALADQSQQGGNASDSDTETKTINLNDYVGQDDAFSISYDAETSADLDSGCDSACGAEGIVYMAFDGGQPMQTGSFKASVSSPGPASDENNGSGYKQVQNVTQDSVTITAEANADVSQYLGPSAGGDADASNIELDVCGANEPPTAENDGYEDVDICTGLNPIDIDILANDNDDRDTKSDLSITQAGVPDAGGSVSVIEKPCSGGMCDWLRLTPAETEGSYSYSFDYRVTDTNGASDIATVWGTVSNNECGSVTIETVDAEDGSSVNADSLGFNFDGSNYSGSGSSYTLNNIPLTDSPKQGYVTESFINPPDGYQITQNEWVLKSTNGFDGFSNDPDNTALGF